MLTLFRKSALLKVDDWSTRALTEDIDIPWRLYEKGYYINYQPRAICYIYVPGTIKGFIKQRLRWARGGIEVLCKHFTTIPKMSWNQRLPGIDMIASYLWVFLVSFSFVDLMFEYLFLHNFVLDLDILITYYVITLLFYLASRFINRHDQMVHFPPKLLCLSIFFYTYWVNNIIVMFIGFYHIFDTVQFASWGSSDCGKGIKKMHHLKKIINTINDDLILWFTNLLQVLNFTVLFLFS